MNRRRLNILGLLPSQLLMVLTVMVPIVIVVIVAFSTRGAYGGFEYTLSFASFQRLLFLEGWSGEMEFNPQYLQIIGRSIALAFLTMVICMVISFPAAYAIARQSGRTKTVLLFLVTLPFWTSMIVRVYAWMTILSRNGVIDTVLQGLGLSDGGQGLLFTNGAMLIGMVYSYVPLMILPVFASIEKLDGALIEASHDLYASRLRTLFKVIVPLTWPGMAAGAVLVFVPSLGAVLEPTLLGGGRKLMMGNLIMNQFGPDRNWPFGAAVALVLMGLVMLVLLLQALRARRIDQGEPA